jgi:hypothetical protein
MKRWPCSICALGVAALLGGCFGGAPSAGSAIPFVQAAQATPAARSESDKEAVVFIPNLSNEVAFYSSDIHDSNAPLLGDITDGITRSQAAWVDTHHILYVLNSEGSPSIEEYKAGSFTPFKTITKDLYVPGFVAVDSKGTIYVDDFNGHGPVLYEYAHGATSPTKTISLPVISEGSFDELALDPANDLYLSASAREGTESYLYELPAGSSKAKQITLSGYPGPAIAIDASGNLYAAGSTGDIAVYEPGATSPSYTASANAEVYGGITVTSNGTLYVPSYNGRLFEFAPKATSPTNSLEVVTGAYDAAVGVF